jgi:hypothetical protein
LDRHHEVQHVDLSLIGLTPPTIPFYAMTQKREAALAPGMQPGRHAKISR